MKKDMAKDMKGMSKKAGNGYMQAPAKKPAKKSK